MLIYQVDAFAEEAFKGNPAAVCVLDEQREDGWMQSVAAEMNLAETAFLSERGEGWDLRWFTPTVEVDLCGHATLASAHVLWEAGLLSRNDPARFHTKSGILTAVRNDGRIELDFPSTPPEPAELPDGLTAALGARAIYSGKTRFDYLLEVESEEVLRRLQPDYTQLRRFPVRGIIVTSRSTNGRFDFVSRFFAPAVGIDEDPVTGSAHCALAPYWAEKLGKRSMTAYQASPRGGVVEVELSDGRVKLAGRAVTVLRGELCT